MKKKIMTFGTIIMLLGIILVPCINATIHTEKQSNEPGRIHGNVYEASFFESPPVILAELVLETEGIKKTTFTGLLGGFEFNDLPIGLTYTITASHPQYHTKVYSYTLSPDKPDLEVAMNLYKKDDRSKVNTINDESTCLGSIYGNAGTSYGWGFSPVGLVKVEAGGKSTISSPIMGFYKIRNLPLGTYTITGTKRGYDTFTDTVKLTERYSDKQVFIHMEPNDKSVNRAKPGISDLTAEKISETLEKAGFGLVHSITMWQKGWWMGELPYVKVGAKGLIV
jgi:hypothetical protein